MKLTIEQALQRGVTAHREGKLGDAEKLYRVILRSLPTHPDANHNLGVLAVGVGKVQEALPFFKSALTANPKLEQFWLEVPYATVSKQIQNCGRRAHLPAGIDELEVGRVLLRAAR